MKIKLLETGFNTLTGDMGGVEFINGVSDDISKAEANRIACNMRVEFLDGVKTDMEKLIDPDLTAPVQEPLQKRTEDEVVAEQAENAAAALSVPEHIYTEAELAKIADEKGIAGLRDICKPLGANGRSIKNIIKEMLEVQAKLIAEWEKVSGKPFGSEA